MFLVFDAIESASRMSSTPRGFCLARFGTVVEVTENIVTTFYDASTAICCAVFSLLRRKYEAAAGGRPANPHPAG